jgi:hypothetical protein
LLDLTLDYRDLENFNLYVFFKYVYYHL